MVDRDGEEIESVDANKEISVENDREKDEGDDDSSSYDPQRVTVPLTLCVAIMVGWVSSTQLHIFLDTQMIQRVSWNYIISRKSTLKKKRCIRDR